MKAHQVAALASSTTVLGNYNSDPCRRKPSRAAHWMGKKSTLSDADVEAEQQQAACFNSRPGVKRVPTADKAA